APASEHAMPAWLRRTALGDLLDTDFDAIAEDPLYEVLDKLHQHRATIEAALIERERSLFNLDATIYLYDLTSTYFEGQCERNSKAKRGYARDHRPDRHRHAPGTRRSNRCRADSAATARRVRCRWFAPCGCQP